MWRGNVACALSPGDASSNPGRVGCNLPRWMRCAWRCGSLSGSALLAGFKKNLAPATGVGYAGAESFSSVRLCRQAHTPKTPAPARRSYRSLLEQRPDICACLRRRGPGRPLLLQVRSPHLHSNMRILLPVRGSSIWRTSEAGHRSAGTCDLLASLCLRAYRC